MSDEKPIMSSDKAIMGSDTDYSNYFSKMYHLSNQAKTNGVQSYLMGDVILDTMQSLIDSKPKERDFLKHALVTQSVEDEKHYRKELNVKCVQDPLYPYQLLICADPKIPQTRGSLPQVHSIGQGRQWRSQDIPLPLSTVKHYLKSQFGVTLDADPVERATQFKEYFPMRYRSEIQDLTDEGVVNACRAVPILDSEHVQILIDNEISTLSDIQRYDEHDDIPSIKAKLKDTHLPEVNYRLSESKHQIRMTLCTQEHGKMKLFFETYAPIVTSISKTQFDSSSWNEIKPALDKYYIAQCALAKPGSILKQEVTIGHNESIKSFKTRFTESLANDQIIGQFRDYLSSKQTSDKLTFAEALEHYPFLSDEDWKQRYTSFPIKVSPDHIIMDKLRQGVSSVDKYTEAINRLLTEDNNPDIDDLFSLLQSTETIIGKPVHVQVSFAASTNNSDRNDFFCKLCSWNGNASGHNTDDCKKVTGGTTAIGYKGYHKYRDNDHYHYPRGTKMSHDDRMDPTKATTFTPHPSLKEQTQTYKKDLKRGLGGKGGGNTSKNGVKAGKMTNSNVKDDKECITCLKLFTKGIITDKDAYKSHPTSEHRRANVNSLVARETKEDKMKNMEASINFLVTKFKDAGEGDK